MTTQQVDTNQRYAERQEQIRDLSSQLGDLNSDDMREFEFREWSPGRTYISLWSTESGEEISIPKYMVPNAVRLMRADKTGPRFVSNKNLAPTHLEGKTLCFLHPDSPYRSLMDNLGFAHRCTSAHHPSEGAMWAVAKLKHKNAFAAYREYEAKKERDEQREEQRQLAAAMLAMAKGSQTPAAESVADLPEAFLCDTCGKSAASRAGLMAHQRSHTTEVQAVPADLVE